MTLAILLAVSFVLPQAEFARYHRLVTGRDPAPDAVRFAVDPAVSASGRDAYRIRSEGEGVRVTGSNLRSVWYGLYDLLERRAGCHWFWDGDVVPKRESIDLSGLDVREEARFEFRGTRYFAHRGLTRFQAEQWGPDEWRREIDWCLKRRLNVFMLRIGQDDLFQRTFPDIVPYPDPSKDLPGHGVGFDNRTLFWSLQYRGELRRRIQRYAFDRGLMVPEDFGTMTHWYSKTPEEFMKAKNPPFLPQATVDYGHENERVWDIRNPQWADAYWRLTQVAVRDYGADAPQQLLHTIGLGERNCYTNRTQNLDLKIKTLHTFLRRAHRDYPDARVLLAGWDFYYRWRPEEVWELIKTLDPKREVIWDYEGDADFYMAGTGDRNDFTQWDVVGKFPYTFSIFLAYESALDIRANYPLIEERQRYVQDDPICAGYIFWPESSHTDTLLLRYFTANAWSRRAVPVEEVMVEFCRSRYGEDSDRWLGLWRMVVPLSNGIGWRGNYVNQVVNHICSLDAEGRSVCRYDDPDEWEKKPFPQALRRAPEIFRRLSDLDWKKDGFVERDAIDLARTTVDRLLIAEKTELLKAYHGWKAGRSDGKSVCQHAEVLKRLATGMADLLELHTDYSLAESYDRLEAVERVTNPNFPNVLVENATCGYCASHQYEAARYWHVPAIRQFADGIVRRIKDDDRSPIGVPSDFDRFRDSRLKGRGLTDMRPTMPRTRESYVRVIQSLAAAAGVDAIGR